MRFPRILGDCGFAGRGRAGRVRVRARAPGRAPAGVLGGFALLQARQLPEFSIHTIAQSPGADIGWKRR